MSANLNSAEITDEKIVIRTQKEARKEYKLLFSSLNNSKTSDMKQKVLKMCVKDLFPDKGTQQFKLENGVMEVSLTTKTPTKIKVDYNTGKLYWAPLKEGAKFVEVKGYREQIFAAILIAMSSQVFSIHSKECYFCIAALSCFHVGSPNIFSIPNYSFENFLKVIEKVMNLDLNIQGIQSMDFNEQSIGKILGLSKRGLSIAKQPIEGHENFRNMESVLLFDRFLSVMDEQSTCNVPWCSYVHTSSLKKIYEFITSERVQGLIDPHKYIKYLNDNADFFFGSIDKNTFEDAAKNVTNLIDYQNQSLDMDFDFQKYPATESIQAIHDQVVKCYVLKKDAILEDKIKNRFETENKAVYKELVQDGDTYTISLPDSILDFLTEYETQRNCIKSYTNSYAENKSHILFLRKNGVPYITIEVEDLDSRKVVQREKSCRRELSEVDKQIMNTLLKH